jgi:hypothetical protein
MSKGAPRAGRLLLAIALTAACASAGCRLLSADFSQERLRPVPAPPGRLYEVDEVGFPETCQADPRAAPGALQPIMGESQVQCARADRTVPYGGRFLCRPAC